MKKLYSLFKRRGGRYYVRFYDDTGATIKTLSTGESDRKKAERKAQEWLKERPGTDKTARLIGLMQSEKLDRQELKIVLQYMQTSGLIASATLPDAPSNRDFIDFCLEFWDFDRSKYVAEKQLFKQNIHRLYTRRNVGFVKKHFFFFKNETISSINRQKIKNFQLFLMSKKLSTESINQITRCATTPLKWAYYNGLTQTDCFTGLRFCAITHQKRKILDIETAARLFQAEWNSPYSKLANLVAMSTGMRAGEIQALRRCDIGEDRLFVRHNYVYKYNEGLKCCKNGEEREIPISKELRQMLLKQVFTNPFGEGDEAFVFYGMLPGRPMDAKPWLTALRRALRSIGYENPEEICFHAWRHFYASVMADVTPERKLQRATGHKTLAMLQHYANHEKAADLELIRQNEETLFGDIIKTANFQ